MNKAQVAPHILFAASVFIVLLSVLIVANNPNNSLTSITGMDIYSSALPVVSNVILNSTHGQNKTNENLTVYWTATDSDGDKVINVTDWRINNRSILLLNLPFENNSNSAATTKDYSSYNHTATVTQATWTKDGYRGGAYVFSSSFNDTIVTSRIIKSLPVTYGGWINFDTFACPGAGGCTPIVQDDISANGYELFADAAGNAGCYAGGSGGAFSSQTPISTGTWYFILCKHTGTELSMYLNGQLIGAPVSSTRLPINQPFRVGPGDLYGGGGLFGFQGKIDDVVVYNRSLSDTEILALYNNRTDLIVTNELSVGENWSVAVTGNDGKTDGNTVISNTVSVNHETTPPSVSTVQPILVNESSSAAVSFNATVSDFSGVSFCELYVNGTDSGGMSISGNTATGSAVMRVPGIFEVLANCSDSFGNYNDTSITNVTVLLVIKNPSYGYDNESVNIFWSTLTASNSTVNFGETVSLGTKYSNTVYTMSNSVNISHLENGTRYFFNITSCTQAGVCETTDPFNFTTLQNGQCINLSQFSDGIHIKGSQVLCTGNYNTGSLSIKSPNLDLRCNNTVLNGSTFTWSDMENISVQNCTIVNDPSTLATFTIMGVSKRMKILNNIIKFPSSVMIFPVNSEIQPDSSIVKGNRFFLANGSTGTGIGFAASIDGGVQRFNITNNLIDCGVSSSAYGISTFNIDTGMLRITNNTIINCGGRGISMDQSQVFGGGCNLCTPANAVISNNTIIGSTVGINLASVISSTIGGNNLSNNAYGIKLYQSCAFSSCSAQPQSNILTKNVFFNSSIQDIFTSTGGGINTLILNVGLNEMKIVGAVLDMVHQGLDLFIGPRIVSLNATEEPALNQSAQLIFSNITSSSTPQVYRTTKFITDPDTVISTGSVCPVSICTGTIYHSSTKMFLLNVTGFSSYAIKTFAASPGGPGGGSGGITPPILPPVIPPVTTPITPVTEQPKGVPGINNLVCTGKQKIENVTTKTTDYLSSLKKGYEVLVSPFSLSCFNSSASLTLSLPDSYTNITAIKCSNGVCGSVSIKETKTLDCAKNIFEDVKRTTTVLTPEEFPLEQLSAELKPGSDVLEASKARIKFVGQVAGKISVDKLFTSVREPINERIRIVGTPTVLTFGGDSKGLETIITLPYAVPEHVDEFSVALFALKNNQWFYLGGEVDTKNKLVTADVKDVSLYTENSKLTVVPMGLICLNCINAKFEKVYNGTSRDAVVLIHGFENTPERFTDILNDIKVTNQPWQAWTFGYPSNDAVEKNAKILADLMELHSGEYDTVYIAAHSLGGLVAQEALHYAYVQNQNNTVKPYTFINKVKKLIAVATPNEGALDKNPTDLLNSLVNNDLLSGLFNINSAVVTELISGQNIPRVPGIEYLVIAGTQPYDFTKLLNVKGRNDGVVTVTSAQTVGGTAVNDSCSNFWSLNTTHTAILTNDDSRKIVERIVSQEIESSRKNQAVLGYDNYYLMEADKCSSADQFVIVGVRLPEKAQPNPGLCNCGNGVCGVDENEVSCPVDCAKIEKPSILSLLLNFKPLRNLLIVLLVLVIAIVIFIGRHKRGPSENSEKVSVVDHLLEKPEKKNVVVVLPKELPRNVSDSVRGNRMDELVVQTRASLRMGDYDKAAAFYTQFNKEYAMASTGLKEAFKSVAESLRKEIRKR